MFLVTLFLTIVTRFFSYQAVGAWNLNKTIGWGYDITNFIWYNIQIPILIFFIGYLLVYILRRNTNVYLSGIHIFLILFNVFLPRLISIDIIVYLFYYLSMGVFFLNLLKSRKREFEETGLEENLVN